MTAARLLPAVVAALVALGCGGRDSPDRAGARTDGARTPAAESAARPALCGRLRARVTGHVRNPAATELSGLVVSRSQRRLLWAHNDSGDGPRILALTPSGRFVGAVAVPGAVHVDWEDIATGPAAGPGDALYVGDIGDNPEERQAVVVYHLAEPRLRGGLPTAPARVRRLTLRYPDGAHDAEALLVDPASGALVIVTKDFGGTARVYVARRPSGGAITTLRRAGRISLGPGQAVTAGDVSANGRTVVLRTYGSAYVWDRRRGQSVAAALRRRPCDAGAGLFSEGQGEALALSRDGRAFFTVAEGRAPALRRYAPRR